MHRRPPRLKVAHDMQAGGNLGRFAPDGDARAITRDLWLVRDPDLAGEGGTECQRVDEAGGVRPSRGFEWIGAPDAAARYESPKAIAQFQERLREAAVRHAELEVAQRGEDLRATERANRLEAEGLSRDIKQRSRSSTVRLLRNIVVLVALTWMLTLICLSTLESSVAVRLTPGALVHRATQFIESLGETASGGGHPETPGA
jgi:hypothetical protein